MPQTRKAGSALQKKRDIDLRAIYGLFAQPESAERAVSSLLDAGTEWGIERDDIAVETSEPLEEYEFGRPDTGTPMPWLAALGGLVGGVGGYLLVTLTQQAYPIPTGGMPIVALWAVGIITYEMTMLGAIVATLVTLLASTRLPDWRTKLHDPEISSGKILIGVINPPERAGAELERRLREAGADPVRVFPQDRHHAGG